MRGLMSSLLGVMATLLALLMSFRGEPTAHSAAVMQVAVLWFILAELERR